MADALAHLSNLITQERVALPMLDTPWDLRYDANGVAYVDNGATSIWCEGDDSLRTAMVRCGPERIIHRVGSNDCVWLDGAFDYHRVYGFSFAFGNPPRTAHSLCGAFRRPCSSSLWRQPADLY